MNKKILTLAIIALATSGCASMPVGSSIDKMRTAKAAGIGCGAGAILGVLVGNKDDALKGCAAGALVGGIGSYRAQLNEARELEAQARSAGMNAQVRTQQVTSDGKQVEVLQSLTIKYSPEDLRAMNAETREVFDKISRLSKKAANELTFTVSGRDRATCSIPVAELAKRDAIGSHKVDDKCGSGDYQLVISPIPDLE